ncbi:DJ-1/PfpI family protein [Streptomyces sp. SL13]|uniref:DJ-1/PfpI family protein n=1 Tax=Streptantibioticus silvisoli TaxID=2705255 RepID=A0AA90KEJ3_9ACTN|nr:DJ-1/PfpI family protein [Streptantibioticus silvisoli]MDI5968085.1 DJ-1/PfpI family protein [Streptantibioticus silvisoli]
MRVVIPVFEGLTVLDAIGPYEVLRMLPGAEVVFAADAAGPVRAHSGTPVLLPDALLADVDACDVLVVPGGPGARSRTRDAALSATLRRLSSGAEWTTSVCTGALLLGAAGLLTGLRATTHWSAVDQLEAYGATYTPERVVFQGRTVTAAGVSAGIDMALALVGRIAGRTRAEAIQLAIEYDPQPPFDAGSPAKAPQAAKDLLA